MGNVTLSRRYSDFRNIPDTWVIGDDLDHPGKTGVYALPPGYSLIDEVISDPHGYECEIFMHSSGRPYLVSCAGPNTESPVLSRVAENGGCEQGVRSMPTNADRICRARKTIEAYLKISGDDDDYEEAICDLIADLGHLCDAEGEDFEGAVRTALTHWKKEREE